MGEGIVAVTVRRTPLAASAAPDTIDTIFPGPCHQPETGGGDSMRRKKGREVHAQAAALARLHHGRLRRTGADRRRLDLVRLVARDQSRLCGDARAADAAD